MKQHKKDPDDTNDGDNGLHNKKNETMGDDIRAVLVLIDSYIKESKNEQDKKPFIQLATKIIELANNFGY